MKIPDCHPSDGILLCTLFAYDRAQNGAGLKVSQEAAGHTAKAMAASCVDIDQTGLRFELAVL
jgi:hypothetical protein